MLGLTTVLWPHVGEILFGDGTKVEIEGNSFWSQEAKIVVFMLCAALAIIPVIAFLIYTVKKNKSDCYSAVDDQKSHQVRTLKRDEDRQIYSAVVFVMMKTDSGAISDAKAAERERIYAAVKDFGLDHFRSRKMKRSIVQIIFDLQSVQ
ncbi:hypothetical protein L3Q82_020365 [Scortum barcoo]|uniref:Uncharacterized protein n=1 Tax=Scortum barcoo TaxID=214431 RepID=A0ACB8V8G4_9TELE|nr:hypothetical protein L3Q82_020365 [Scortum barcoo]